MKVSHSKSSIFPTPTTNGGAGTNSIGPIGPIGPSSSSSSSSPSSSPSSSQSATAQSVLQPPQQQQQQQQYMNKVRPLTSNNTHNNNGSIGSVPSLFQWQSKSSIATTTTTMKRKKSSYNAGTPSILNGSSSHNNNNNKRHMSLPLMITALVVCALFLNVIFVHVQLFQTYSSILPITSPTSNSNDSNNIHNTNDATIDPTANHNKIATSNTDFFNEALSSFAAGGNKGSSLSGEIEEEESSQQNAAGSTNATTNDSDEGDTEDDDENEQQNENEDEQEQQNENKDGKDQQNKNDDTDNEEEEDVDEKYQENITSSYPTDPMSILTGKEKNEQYKPSPYNSFSACMLIKDDNDLLNEWLAYHYYVLNLRYLVVAVDPNSATSPSPIFAKWRNLTDLKIVEWSDPNFMPKVFLLTGYHIAPSKLEVDPSKSKFHDGTEDEEKIRNDMLMITNHRYRQVTFLAACLKHMKNHKKTWTMHIDTDEFVVINPLLRNTTQSNVEMVSIPPITRAGSILNVVKQYFNDNVLRSKYNYPCISMPRLLFGSVEYKENATYPEELLDYNFDVSKLETIRWQYHTDYDDKDRNAQPKVIVDVSVVPRQNDMFIKPFSIHRPSKQLCRRISQLDFKQLQRYPITVNHYLGSWERYYYSKNDTRRNERAYNYKAHVSFGHDNYIAPWLIGFINSVGLNRTKELLHDYFISNDINDSATEVAFDTVETTSYIQAEEQ